MRYGRLTSDWLLRGWCDIPFALLNWKTGTMFPLDGHVAHVVRHCDGQSDFDSLLFMPWHGAILDRLIARGIATPSSRGETLAPQQAFRQATNPYQAALQWAVTGRCNLNCRHCYMGAPDRLWQDLSTAQLLAIVTQMENANLPQVSITGGEPFMRKDLVIIVRALLERCIGIRHIMTNGTLIQAPVLDALAQAQVFPEFCLSFDGVGLHDAMRGCQGVERPVVAAIQKLLERGYPLIVTTSVDGSTTPESLTATFRLMQSMGVDEWKVAAPVRTGRWADSTNGLSLTEEVRLYRGVLQLWHDAGRPMRLQLGSLFNSRTEVLGGEGPPQIHHYSADDLDCGACKRMPHLTADATFLPCHAYSGRTPPPGMPNLTATPLADLLSASTTSRIIRLTKRELLAHNPGCETCNYFSVCGMGCRARAYIETGDLYARDPIACRGMRDGHQAGLLESIMPSGNI